MIGTLGVRRSKETGVGSLAGNRDFRLLWIGQAHSELGTSVSSVAMPLLALAITGSEVLAGLLSTVTFVVMMLASMPGGYLADRYDGRRLMVVCDAVRAVLMLSVGVAVVLGAASIWHLMAVVVVGTVADMAFEPASARAVRAIVTREQIPAAVSIAQSRSYAAELVGPSASGLLFATGRAIPFLADAVSYVVSLACVLGLRSNLRPAEPASGALRFFPGIAAGWSAVWRDAFLRSTTLYSTTMNVAVSTLLFVLILGEGRHGSGGAVVVGVALSLAAAAGLAGSFLAPLVQRRVRFRTLLVGVAALRGAMIVAAVVTGSTLALALALASVVLLSPVIGAAMSAARMIVVPEEIFGRVTGTSSFVAGALQPAAPLLAGALVQFWSQQAALTVIAVAFGLVTLFAATIRGLDFTPPAPDSAA